MCALRIVADENMPLVKEFFEEFGEIKFLPGRSITADDVRDADILLVRSITRVDETLLKGSRVRFVGTATIGFDHIDVDYLKKNKIGFACAPGCNASSVVEYVISTLSVLAEQGQFNLHEKTVGIVGVGNVGELLQKRLTQIGIHCVCNDPPRTAKGEEGFIGLDELMRMADIVTIHTPLIKEGEYKTHHLFDAPRLNELKAHAILINTARGSVVDNNVLRELLEKRHDVRAVLDVWENEPDINLDLLHKTAIATPHIAGYSLDGKIRGTEMIYKAVCRHFGLPVRKKAGQFAPDPALEKLNFSEDQSIDEALNIAIRSCYDVRRDDASMRDAACRFNTAFGSAFDNLRKNYPVRREFSNLKIKIKHGKVEVIDVFKALGFPVKAD
jgi:erythronate-4-phosphate dehydrogenase